jgi:hypothetical protein
MLVRIHYNIFLNKLSAIRPWLSHHHKHNTLVITLSSSVSSLSSTSSVTSPLITVALSSVDYSSCLYCSQNSHHQKFYFIVLLFVGYFRLVDMSQGMSVMNLCSFVTDKEKLISLWGSLINSQIISGNRVQFNNTIEWKKQIALSISYIMIYVQ